MSSEDDGGVLVPGESKLLPLVSGEVGINKLEALATASVSKAKY